MRRMGSETRTTGVPARTGAGAGRGGSGHWTFLFALALMAAGLLTPVRAQTTGASTPAQASGTAVTKTVIRLWPGVAPGSEDWKQPEIVVGSGEGEQILNVRTPTLTAYLPAPSIATGTAVIIAPGGGFVALAINHEGSDEAKWLAARGIAGIVLKYRTVQLAGNNAAEIRQSAGAAFMAQLRDHAVITRDGQDGIADGIQAVKVVRAHAAVWGISPQRIVFMGFSAGGMIADFTAIRPDARPNYVAPIYGAPIASVPPIPTGLPPFFIVMTQDDRLAGTYILRFYEALKAAGYKPEFLLFSTGGHGFGMGRPGTSSDHWIHSFYYWLAAQGLTRPLR